MTRLEASLRAALLAGTEPVAPSPDLFERVEEGLARQRARWRWRRRVLAIALVPLAALAAVLIATIDIREGEMIMDWWIYEVIVFVVLTAIALALGPFIKRFGKSYAAEVFRSNPTTGKSFIVLTDFAYYLIFTAYILFTTRVDQPTDWSDTVSADQVQFSVVRLGGILLILGALHGINLVLLPVIGRLLTLNRRLDQQMRDLADRDLGDRDLDQS
jgi:hypothetical protein